MTAPRPTTTAPAHSHETSGTRSGEGGGGETWDLARAAPRHPRGRAGEHERPEEE
ncbi:MAG: hypothetical protein ACRDGT_00095 [Candidatus Limnocylindria bacterium]